MTIHSIPLVATFENRTSSVSKDAKMVNGYMDVENKEKAFAVKRPGYSNGTLYEAAAAQGVVNYLGVNRVFVNNKFYKNPTTAVAIDAAGGLIDCT